LRDRSADAPSLALIHRSTWKKPSEEGASNAASVDLPVYRGQRDQMVPLRGLLGQVAGTLETFHTLSKGFFSEIRIQYPA
jgi:hypothetical protein